MQPRGASIDEVANLFVKATRSAMLFGAGLSASEAGLPLFGQLFERSVDALMLGDPLTAGFRNLVVGMHAELGSTEKRLRPEEFFAAVETEAPRAGVSLARQVFELGVPGPSHEMVATLSNALNSPVLTTNFDVLIERSKAAGVSAHVVHLHGSVWDEKSIRIAVNDVAGHNARRIRGVAGPILRDRTVLVGGYQGLDSDVFPLLSEANCLLWLVYSTSSEDPLVLARNRLPHLWNLNTEVTVCAGNIAGLLDAVAGAAGLTPRGVAFGAPAIDTPPWADVVDQWATVMPPLQRRLVVARLLSHAGHFTEAGICYNAAAQDGRDAGDAALEAAALAGVVRVIGASQGNSRVATQSLDRLLVLSRKLGWQRRTSLLSAALNAAEAASVAGVPFSRVRYAAAFLPPWAPGDWGRFGKIARQTGARCISRRRICRGRLWLTAAWIAAASRGDFEEMVIVKWYLSLADVEVGRYSRALSRLSSIPPTDRDFVGATFRFWFDWLLRDFKRLGAPDQPHVEPYGANSTPNAAAMAWDEVSKLSSERLTGMMSRPERERSLSALSAAVQGRQEGELRVRVLIENSLPITWAQPRRQLLLEEATSLERLCARTRDWLVRDYARLIRVALRDESLSSRSARLLLASPSLFVRAVALSGVDGLMGPLPRAFLRRLIANRCVRRGMLRERSLLAGEIPFDWDVLQFP